MGTTIRREPVSFNIPSAPDYKFLNITNFRGLDVSSNPFELASNTASDCLNVYVDETNTLTTRPRLEKKELKDTNGDAILPLNGTCLGVYPLHDGYLFHYTQEMKLLRGNTLSTVTADKIPQTKCKHFEHGDKIYLLGDGRYMVVSDNKLADVEGYVPNTSIIRLDGTVEKDEQLNLLSDKYTEKYFWDGVSDPKISSSPQNTKNEYYIKENIDYRFSGKIPMTILENKTALWRDGDKTVGVYNFDPEFDGYREIYTTHGIRCTDGSLASGRKSFNLWEWNYNPNYPDSLYFLNYEDEKFVRSESIELEGLNNSNYWQLSPDGYYMMTSSSDGIVYLFHAADVSDNGKYSITYEVVRLPSTEYAVKYVLSNNKIWCVHFVDNKTIKIYVSDLNNVSFTEFDTYTDPKIFYGGYKIDVTENDEIMWIYNHDTVIVYRNGDSSLRNVQKKTYVADIHINSDGFAWTTQDWLTDTKTALKIYTIPNLSKINDRYLIDVFDVKPPKNTSNTASDDFCCFYKNNFLFYKFDISTSDTLTTENKSFLYIWNDNKEPNITVTKQITKYDDVYSEFTNARAKLLNANMFTRFDNNYWFASGNSCFWSEKNDPTYFTTTNNGELGDSNEHITGFNVANDTTLLVYKDNRTFLIQPIYLETTGTREYTITESKNTVGNTAEGSAIVTTLTEIPLQINYDGVYGLSQVANVSAVERVADLMSEPINDRWLNEKDSVIKKSQTLNRLYWTYIILPDEVCKVYLLDNRTNSWYYWELPINLLSAHVKDNHAEFVDTDGNIYFLTTTDIRNMDFDTQLITEYYDANKKLIPWYWQSQILPLGTMNYSKRLVNTTFILTDTDTQDGYGLNYSFKVFRKLASGVPEKELSGDLNLVRSTTKKTNISKFGFLQIKLSNITEESQGTEAEKAYRNNKLRLVGLGLKYVLLEGLIR